MDENVISVQTVASQFYGCTQIPDQQTRKTVRHLQVFITAIDSDNWTGSLRRFWFRL